MTRPLIILTIFLTSFSCNRTEEKVESKTINLTKQIDLLEPDLDTLPNGIRLLDNVDSGMVNYYKEVVGSDTLKGGYILCYGIDDSTKYLYIKKGENLHLLNKTPIYTSTWSLGTIEKDFTNSILTQIDNGNGCPSSYQLFDKQTGENILGEGLKANGYISYNDTLFMFYDNWSKNKQADTLTLLNVKTKRREFFKLPNNLPEFCDIQIEKLSKKNLKVTLETFVGDRYEKSKTYSR
jgi:hypothetical protein